MVLSKARLTNFGIISIRSIFSVWEPSNSVEQPWYLACDMEMDWLSPLIFIPLWKYPKFGKILLAVLLIVGVAIAFTMPYCYERMVSFVSIWTM